LAALDIKISPFFLTEIDLIQKLLSGVTIADSVFNVKLFFQKFFNFVDFITKKESIPLYKVGMLP